MFKNVVITFIIVSVSVCVWEAVVCITIYLFLYFVNFCKRTNVGSIGRRTEAKRCG